MSIIVHVSFQSFRNDEKIVPNVCSSCSEIIKFSWLENVLSYNQSVNNGTHGGFLNENKFYGTNCANEKSRNIIGAIRWSV